MTRSHHAYKHGHSTKVRRTTPEFQCWRSMRQRCRNPKNPGFHRYGGRGIAIDPAWDDFVVFLRDMGLRPSPKHSIGRIDNDGPYAKWNCRWETIDQQAVNKRRKTTAIEDYDYQIQELATCLGIKVDTLRTRIRGTEEMKPWTMARIIYNGTMWG